MESVLSHSGAKKHFIYLDGLRGIAALAVVVFHFMEIIFPDVHKNVLGHGFLAVDFFFCLSGFVMGYAYDNRIEQIGITQFFKSRMIRLHPLVVIGSVLGLIGFLFDPFSAAAGSYSAGRILMIFVTSILMIPFPVMEDRFFNLFGLNAPAWSLFWEYIANIVYAVILYRLSKKYLIVCYIISIILLGYTVFEAGTIIGGWSGPTFWDGGARVLYSFLAGLLIYRNKLIIRNQLGFIRLSLLLLLAFLLPSSSFNWLSELMVVVIYFPLLVALGAGTINQPVSDKISKFSGDISYPLYMTHYVALWFFNTYYTTQQPKGISLVVTVVISVMLLVLFAYLIMEWVDKPLRKFLTNKFILKQNEKK